MSDVHDMCLAEL